MDTQVGQIELARFVNPEGLLSTGKNLYLQTEASGDPVAGTPADSGFGEIMSGFVELSNVDPVRELIDLIFTQRAFELNSQTIQSADETLQIVGVVSKISLIRSANFRATSSRVRLPVARW